jgi:hypothetical protein
MNKLQLFIDIKPLLHVSAIIYSLFREHHNILKDTYRFSM